MTCRIVFLQVGNADCTLVRTPDACAIVDLPKQRPLNDRLKRHEICSIDRVFVTHDHKDHFLGLERLANWLEAWVRGKGSVVALHLPYGLWQRPCAGDIIVEAETDGRWSWPAQEEHRETVKSVPFAACLSTHQK